MDRLPETPFNLSNCSDRQLSKYELKGDRLTAHLEKVGRNPDFRKDTIYPYQREAVLATKEKIEAHRRTRREAAPFLIQAPAGSGKSGMIVLLPYVLKSRKVLIITPSKVIGDQLSTAFGHHGMENCFFKVSNLITNENVARNFLEPVLVVLQSKVFVDNLILPNVVIVNAQKFGGKSDTTLSFTYGKRVMIKKVKEVFAQFDTLIVDEAHHYPAETWKKIVDAFKAPVNGMERNIIFLTATPYRIVKGKKVPILPEQQTSFTVTPEMVQEITTRVSIFWEHFEPERNYNRETNLADDICAIFEWQMELEPRLRDNLPQAMILVRTKEEANYIAEKLNEDTRCETFALAVHTDNERSKNYFIQHAHSYKVAVTCGLLIEGYDNCNVSLCVILRKVRSQVLFNQFVGRCTRKHRFPEGGRDKTIGVVLSYSKFEQKYMWDNQESLALFHPVLED